MTSTLNKRFHALLAELNLKEAKAEIIHSFTNGRTSSSKELSVMEFQELIRKLAADKKQDVKVDYHLNKEDAMRKKIFSLAYQMGYAFNGNGEDMKMNQAKVYGLVERIGYLKPKLLMQYNAQELVKLVSQFEKMLANNEYQQSREIVRNAFAEMNEAERRPSFKGYLNNY